MFSTLDAFKQRSNSLNMDLIDRETNDYIRSSKSRTKNKDQQLSLQPLLELDDPGYSYDDYEYDEDEDEEEFNDDLSYQEYNTEVLNLGHTKQNSFGSSIKFLPDKDIFQASPSRHLSPIHPNSVLPVSKNKNLLVANEPMKHNTFLPNANKGQYTSTKSKYHKNYMLQSHVDAPIPQFQEAPESKKPSSIFASKDKESELPQFLRDPEDSYVIRRKSATLKCEVTGADKAYFSCNGEAMGRSAKDGDKKSFNRGQHHEEDTVRLADEKDMTGRMITVKILSLEVTEGQIEEFFGVFTCRCDAWNKKGRSSSKNASVEIACKSNV